MLNTHRRAKKSLGMALIGILFSYSAISYAGSFSGIFSGSITSTSSTTISIQGSGKVTQGGKSTNAGIVTILNTVGNCLNVSNEEIITVANRDTIKITILDISCPISEGVFQGIGTFKITGGTGKFANATGSGTFNGQGDFNQGQFTFKLMDGTIDFK